MKNFMSGFMFGIGAYTGMSAMREFEERILPELSNRDDSEYGEYETRDE